MSPVSVPCTPPLPVTWLLSPPHPAKATSDDLVARPLGQHWLPSPTPHCPLPSLGCRTLPLLGPFVLSGASLPSLLHQRLHPWSPLRRPGLASSPLPLSLGIPSIHSHGSAAIFRALSSPPPPSCPPDPSVLPPGCPAALGLPWPNLTSSVHPSSSPLFGFLGHRPPILQASQR